MDNQAVRANVLVKKTFLTLFGSIFLNCNPDFDVRAGHDRLRLRITQPGCEAGAAVDHWRITRCTHEPKRAKHMFASSNRDEEEGISEGSGKWQIQIWRASNYKVIHLLKLTWIFNCIVCTFLPWLPEIWQKRHSSLAKKMEHPNQSQPNRGPRSEWSLCNFLVLSQRR